MAGGRSGIVILWIVSIFVIVSGKCYDYSEQEYYSVEYPETGLHQIHVRHNLKGEVHFAQKTDGTLDVGIQVIKTGASAGTVKYVSVNYTLYTPAPSIHLGNVLVVQVDKLEPETGLAKAVIGIIVGLLTVVIIAGVCTWLFKTKHFCKRGQFILVKTEDKRATTSPVVSTTEVEEDDDEGGFKDKGTSGRRVPEPPPPPARQTAPSQSNSRQANGKEMLPIGRGVSQSSKAMMVTLGLVALLSVVCASCLADVRVKVILLIPPFIKLETVQAFFNEDNGNKMVTDDWWKNSTTVQSFRVKGSPSTDRPPCKGDCEVAYAENLVGCDPRSGNCICEEGYMLKDDVCVDVDECTEYRNQAICPLAATCRNTIGSYTCQCSYGFFRDSDQCRVCSVGCPDGMFEANPCSYTADRICQECSQCSGAMYEVKPCTGGTDRKCMHAAHPLMISEEAATPTYLDGLKLEGSDNVFMENLHSSRNLETRYYITANGQASDYHWVRESKLGIKVGVYGSQLLPEYEDVDHQSDNHWMLENPNTSEDKNKFKDIINKYCRNPMPDYYSIALEISRDRATRAREIICDSTDPHRHKCPPEYRDGDKYVLRTQNSPCEKMGTYPEALQPAINDVVCTQKTKLLTEVFNQTYRREKPIKFPDSDCKNAGSRCDQCLDHKCKMRDPSQQHCCQIECYTLDYCKKATSEHCTSTRVECAMGDAFRYTIQPVFQNIREEFQCHLRRKKPKILYNLFYYIEIDGRLTTDRVDITVNSSDLEYQSKGTFLADYITVEHNSGLDLQDSFVLVGKAQAGPQKYKYQLHTLKREEEFNKKKVTIHKISHNTYVASMQFSKPFAYSTSSWTKGNQCDKDTEVMHQVQKLYKEDPQGVNVNVKNKMNKSAPYEYIFRANQVPPQFRLSVKGNVSILSWYFKDGPTLLVDTIKSSLMATWDRKIWKISLSGMMTDCKGWFNVIISDRTTLEELFNYDMLIFCPRDFNLTFFIPNWGRGIDRTFDLKLTDGRKSYAIYLTNMVFEPEPVKTLKKEDMEYLSETVQAVWPGVNIIGFIFVACLVVSFLFCICLLCTRKRRGVYKVNASQGGTRLCCAPNTQLDTCQCCVVVVYAAFRLLYSLIFTFTVIGALITHVTQADFKKLEGITQYQSVHMNKSRKLAREISDYGQQELLRQTKLMLGMQGSCSVYMDDLYSVIARQMKNLTTNPQLRQSPSLSYYIQERFRYQMEKFESELGTFKDRYKKHFDNVVQPPLSTYERYLEDVYENKWLDIPKNLFNRTAFVSRRPDIFQKNRYLSGKVVDFMSFLEVEETERVQLIPHQIWQRFHGSIPDFPKLKIKELPLTLDECLTEQSKFSKGKIPMMHLDSVRYYSEQLPGKTEIGPKFEHHNSSLVFKFIPKDEAPKYEGLLFSMQKFVSKLNLQMFKYLFMAMDVLLLICRCTRTYMNIQKLCNGFEETEPLDDTKYENLSHPTANYDHEADMMQVGGRPDVTNTGGTSLGVEENLLDLTGAPSSDSQRRMLADSFGSPKSYNVEKNSLVKQPKKKTQPNQCSSVISSWLQHSMVPKLIIAVLLLGVYYLCIMNVYYLVRMDVISYYGGYQSFISDLDLRINQTNEYLAGQAAHLNNVSMAIFKRQMDSELLGMQSTLDYFNWQQSHMAASFKAESCAFREVFLSNRTCDVNVLHLSLDLPVLPCNFVPIKAQLYAGIQKEAFLHEVKRDLVPFAAALRAFLIKSSYAVLIVIVIMFLIHIGGALLFLFLKTRLVFPLYKIYITSVPPAVMENRIVNTEGRHPGDSGMPAGTSNTTANSVQSLDSTDFTFSETKV